MDIYQISLWNLLINFNWKPAVTKFPMFDFSDVLSLLHFMGQTNVPRLEHRCISLKIL